MQDFCTTVSVLEFINGLLIKFSCVIMFPNLLLFLQSSGLSILFVNGISLQTDVLLVFKRHNVRD